MSGDGERPSKPPTGLATLARLLVSDKLIQGSIASVVGLGAYLVGRFVAAQFYGQFGLDPADVGLGQSDFVAFAAVLTALAVFGSLAGFAGGAALPMFALTNSRLPVVTGMALLNVGVTILAIFAYKWWVVGVLLWWVGVGLLLGYHWATHRPHHGVLNDTWLELATDAAHDGETRRLEWEKHGSRMISRTYVRALAYNQQALDMLAQMDLESASVEQRADHLAVANNAKANINALLGNPHPPFGRTFKAGSVWLMMMVFVASASTLILSALFAFTSGNTLRSGKDIPYFVYMAGRKPQMVYVQFDPPRGSDQASCYLRLGSSGGKVYLYGPYNDWVKTPESPPASDGAVHRATISVEQDTVRVLFDSDAYCTEPNDPAR